MRVELSPGIVADSEVHFGKPIVEGTRVPVELVIGKLAGGMTVDEVAEEYDLTADNVRAALRYAAKVLAEEEVRVVA